jgi:hypothetical protein
VTRRHVLIAALCLALGAGCSGDPVGVSSDSPSARPDVTVLSTPRFLRPAPDAPSLAKKQVSFYAVRGKYRQASIVYHAHPGASDSTRLVLFSVPAQSLVKRPDGTTIAPGDSLRITLTVIDTVKLIVRFRPDGLNFASGYPANLKMSYAETNPDINGDGVVNAIDAGLEALLKIWRQEIGEPFSAIQSVLDEAHKTVSASITGFTNYAVAY